MFDVFLWSIIGIILFIIECFIVQGMGIVFPAMSAITVSGYIYYNLGDMEGATGTQLMSFIGFTFAWGSALWIPLHYVYGYGTEDKFKNIIGAFGTVYDTITKEDIGAISYAGVLVKARLDPTSTFEALDPKTHVKITAVDERGIHVVKSIREEVDMSTLIPSKKKRKKAA